MKSAAQGHEVEGTVPSQWWLDLKVENQRLREALTYYAEGRYPDGGEIAREALAVPERNESSAANYPQHDPFVPPVNAAIGLADIEFVLRWLRQADAPENIIELQERGLRLFLATEAERPVRRLDA